MTTLPKISLNKNWRYRYAPLDQEFSGEGVIDSDWAWTNLDKLVIVADKEPKKIWVRNRFHLQVTNECVRYFLRCERFVFPARFYLRGNLFAEVTVGQSLDIDVTDDVSLSDNMLVIAIDPSGWKQTAQTTDLYLEPVLCAEFT